LTFDQWLNVWAASGHLEERGRKRGQYVMARPGDLGAYEVGNIKITVCGDNLREAHLGIPRSEDVKQRIAATKTGVSRAPFTAAHKANLSAANYRRWAA
jgi:hypothetical protein